MVVVVLLTLLPACGGVERVRLDALANARFVDNGDGTITDTTTGLMWEKKSDDGTIHDKDNKYTWTRKRSGACEMTGSVLDCTPGTEPNGTVFTDFLRAMNNASCESKDSVLECDQSTPEQGFAGYTDWRLPSAEELLTLLEPWDFLTNMRNFFNPKAAAIFHAGCMAGCTVTTCSCTKANRYWSSDSGKNYPPNACTVHFLTGQRDVDFKGNSNYVRAVRGGS